jgi:uncharacterized membrane protein
MTSPPRPRLVFVDQARALAIAMMLMGHSLDRFLGEPWRSSAVYDHYTFVRGLSSALFLFIAGFSFVIASFGRLESYTSLSDPNRLVARLRRIALILFLGILLQLPATTFSGALEVTDPAVWERFFGFNVLQNIGLSLLLLHVILFVARTPDRFGKTVAALAVLIFFSATITFRPEVDAVIPTWIRGALNLYHQSRFPMVPFTGFICLGAVLGWAYWKEREKREHKVFIAACAVAVLLIAFDLVIRKGVPDVVFPYGIQRSHMASNTFARAGSAVLIVSGLYFLSRSRTVLPRLSFVLSKDSLAIYFTHLWLVFGAATRGGLFASQAEKMTPLEAGLFIVSLFLGMTGMAYLFGHLRKRRPVLFAASRRTLVMVIVLSYFLLVEPVWYSVAAMLVPSAGAVYLHFRLRSEHETRR